MASKVVSDGNSDKMDCDLEVFKKQISECIEWFKSDPNKRVWPEGCARLGKNTFRKRNVHYGLVDGTEVLFSKMKEDGGGN